MKTMLRILVAGTVLAMVGTSAMAKSHSSGSFAAAGGASFASSSYYHGSTSGQVNGTVTATTGKAHANAFAADVGVAFGGVAISAGVSHSSSSSH